MDRSREAQAPHTFSRRIPDTGALNQLTEALAAARASDQQIIDLTESNPTRADFAYPADLLSPMSVASALTYGPKPFGLLSARQAVAADYARRGIAVSPERIALTASTSEAYSLLFKVLCDPGDEVLVPRPSYPLFEHLTRLDGVVAKPYDLDLSDGWSIEFGSVTEALSDRTRAVLIVSPNNPTGTYVKADDGRRLAMLCASRGCALVADEVFADYELQQDSSRQVVNVLDDNEALAFSLGGCSKSVGLPQVKLGWIAAGGPETLVTQAMDRLEFACDAYLSVSTPVQLAAGELLTRGAAVRDQIRARTMGNYQQLAAILSKAPALRLIQAEAGWSAVMQVPSLGPEEQLVLDLLADHNVLVHPGYFFDFPRESYLIVSLLLPELQFHEGISRIVRHFDCKI